MTTDQSTFGRELKRLRLAAGLSQEELAARAGLSTRGISDLEREINRRPRRDTVRLLCEALGLSPEEAARFETASRPSKTEVSVKASSTADKLPKPLTSLVGRESDVRAAMELLQSDGVRLVTLLGPGGVGKTRLAIECASRLREQYRDGAVFVDLTPVATPDRVAGAIASALGLDQNSAQPLDDQVRAHLVSREMLLVFDNFEHLLPAARLVGELLISSPGLKCLVTSRAPLHISGEVEYQLNPLLVPELLYLPDVGSLANNPAVELFVSRARLLSQFELTNANAGAVAEICVRLDGLPFAIELAAARVKVLPPESMVQRLDRRLQVLGSGPSDMPARQRTLTDTLAWSHSLLADREQMLFRRLAVFVGGWALEAATVVCGLDDTETLEAVSALLDNNLIARTEGPAPRFRMLETVREYARLRLVESGEMEPMQETLLRFIESLALREEPLLRTADWLASCGRILAELDNVRAALTWAHAGGGIESGLRAVGGLLWFWSRQNLRQEGREWAARLLEAAPLDLEESLAFARAELTAGGLAWFQGDIVAADRWLASCRAKFERTQDDDGLGQTLFYAGLCSMTHGDSVEGFALLGESVRMFRRTGEQGHLAVSLYVQGDAATHTDLELASRLYGESLAISRSMGDSWGVANCVVAMGHLRLNLGDLEGARVLCEEGLELRRQQQEAYGYSTACAGLGEVALREGKLEQASDLLEEALENFVEQGNEEHVSWVLYDLACVELARDDLATARRYLERSIDLSWQHQNYSRVALCLIGLARTHVGESAQEAAVLFAACQAILERRSIVLEPIDVSDVESTGQLLHLKLDSEGLAKALDAGRSLSESEAVALAMGLTS